MVVALRYGELYDYYRDFLRPCLMEEGYDVSAAPGFDRFVAGFDATAEDGGGPWDPFGEATEGLAPSSTELQSIKQACPPYPSTWWDGETLPALALFTMPPPEGDPPPTVLDVDLGLTVGDARLLWQDGEDQLWGLLAVQESQGEGVGESVICLAYVPPERSTLVMARSSLTDFAASGLGGSGNMPDGAHVTYSWTPEGRADIEIRRGDTMTTGTNAGELR